LISEQIVIPARRPDIVVLDKEERKLTIIDVAVPSDANIKDKEKEKITKYQEYSLCGSRSTRGNIPWDRETPRQHHRTP
jgi:hypothetical protein